MCKVDVFCCGCSLRAGAITAAVLTAISAVASLIYAGVFFHQASKFKDAGYPDHAQALQITAVVYIVSAVLAIIIFIFLVLALRQNRAGFVMPWLICAMINIVLLGINTIYGVLGRQYAMLVMLPILAFLIYLWIVVLNYYRELRNGGTGRQVGKV